jgi:hypothetical protein
MLPFSSSTTITSSGLAMREIISSRSRLIGMAYSCLRPDVGMLAPKCWKPNVGAGWSTEHSDWNKSHTR